ncbi:MAG TPA: sigma-70 family RNA polymerase sigma factor [Solirubrobacteraceae bacterium]|jgi:RNA polymerase sigma factor (sigma-70 family)|nr:sigma-70 family RNA polymerase sigma factor [Solirubrobacteraceae bacterium]
MPGLSGPSALLRLQSDERLIAMTRRGQHAAFEVLFSRYQSRLLAFCRHMLSSREDAEDVLQEVFTAAFNAVLADEREINVRPWLYRIARNRSLNHLRRASAIGVDSMDVHYADNGLSTGERVLKRESFRQLLGDVKELPETQRTALLLREIDALSYEQIADAMETTVPSVKSLLVRARISLAEAAEARQLSCEEVRMQLGEVAEGLTKLAPPARRHVRGCERCRSFKKQLRENNHALAAIFPVGPLLLAKKLLLTKLGSTASAGHVGAGAGATAGATASAAGAGAGGAGAAGGILTAGAGAVATKAVAGLAAAAIVTAVATGHVGHPAHRHHSTAATTAYVARHASEPIVVHASVQSVSSTRRFADNRSTRRLAHPRLVAKTAKIAAPVVALHPPAAGPAVLLPAAKPVVPPKQATAPVTEVTTETTTLPTKATDAPPQQSAPSTTATDPTGGTPSPPAEPTPPAATAPPVDPPVEPPPPPVTPPTGGETGQQSTPPSGAAPESTSSSAVASQATPSANALVPSQD